MPGRPRTPRWIWVLVPMGLGVLFALALLLLGGAQPAAAADLGVVTDTASGTLPTAPAPADLLADAPADTTTVVEPVADAAQPVADTVDQVVAPVAEPVVDAVEPIVAPVVDVVEPVVAPVVDVVEPVVDPVVEVLAPVVDVVEPIVAPVLDVLEPVVDVVEPVVGPVVDVVEPIVAPVVDVVEPVIDPVVEVLAPVVDVVEPLVDVVEPVVAPLLDVVEPIVDPVLEVLEPVVPVLAPVVEPVLDVVGPVVAPAPPVPTPPGPAPVADPVVPAGAATADTSSSLVTPLASLIARPAGDAAPPSWSVASEPTTTPPVSASPASRILIDAAAAMNASAVPSLPEPPAVPLESNTPFAPFPSSSSASGGISFQLLLFAIAVAFAAFVAPRVRRALLVGAVAPRFAVVSLTERPG